MNDGLKSLLGIVLAISLGVLCYSMVVFVGDYGKSIQPSSFRSFWASGEGKATAVPDIAEFTFSVLTEGKTDVAKLQQDNTTKMNAAIDYVKGQGIDAKDINTENYSIDPRYDNVVCDYRPGSVCPPPQIVGYSVRQDVMVKIRKFELISSLLTGVVTAGANTVSQLSFTLDDPTSTQDDARQMAITKAMASAQKIAKDTGFTLGRLLEIDDGGTTVPQPRAMMAYDKVSVGATMATPPSIEPGSQETTVSVRLKYEIQ